jgi:hypothetical protein
MSLYLSCFAISLLGLGLSILLVLKSLTTKARLANVIFDFKLFWKTDAIFQIIGTFLTVGIALMLLGPFLKKYPAFSDNTLIILVIFSALGYLGSDVASRFFSVVNSRINGAIDFKTTQADKMSGNLDAPTPATKPQS